MKSTIGLIAGNGKLPILLAKGIRAAGHRVAAIGHIGETQKGIQHHVDSLHWVPIGALGKIIDLLLQEKAQSAIIAGQIAKTHFFSRAQPDLRAIQVLSRLPDKKDDAILRAIAQEIESEGVKVESPIAFLQENMAPQGCWTERKPTEREGRDIEFGWRIAKEVANLDFGQCIVVKDQMVLAVEAMEGTDKTIRRGGKLGRGDVLVIKVVKPKQDLRLDLPVIGLATMRTLRDAGASALAVEAQKTIVIDTERVISEANKNHFCLIGI
jgi:UDP-2,3-diacylglucosamine hydrolase